MPNACANPITFNSCSLGVKMLQTCKATVSVPLWFPCGSFMVQRRNSKSIRTRQKNWRFRKFYTFPAPMTAVQPILISKVRMVGEAIVHIVFGDSKWTWNRFRTVWERLPFLYKCGKLLDAPLNALLHKHTHTMYEILKQNPCISGTCYLQSPASSSGKAKERHPLKSWRLDKISNTIQIDPKLIPNRSSIDLKYPRNHLHSGPNFCHGHAALR